jgi:hypothetical protein
VLWLCGWAAFQGPPGKALADGLARVAGPYAGYLDGFVLPLLADAAPSVSRFPLLVPGLGAFSLAAAVLARRFRRAPEAVVPVALLAIAIGFLVASSYLTLLRTGSRQARDLYDAQVWARGHTAPGDMFIVHGGSWRAFSERPAFVPLNLGYYMYLPDRRIKAHDDFVFRFYGIERPYGSGDQKSLMQRVERSYRSMREMDFYNLALATNAKYLVETRRLALPLVYRNSTYAIYRLL